MSKTTLKRIEILRISESTTKRISGDSTELRIAWSNDFHHRVAINAGDKPITVAAKLVWLANAISVSERNAKL